MKKITCCTLLKMWANKCWKGTQKKAEKRGEKNIAKCAHKAEREAQTKARASVSSKAKAKPKAAGAARRLLGHCPCHLACSAIRGLQPELNPFMQRDSLHAHTPKHT